MGKSKNNIYFVLTILQVVVAGKELVLIKAPSKDEVSSRKVQEDAELKKLMVEHVTLQKTEIREPLIDEKKDNFIIESEKEAFEFAERLRSVIDRIDHRLKENHVSESDILVIEDGYRAVMKMGRCFSTQLQYQKVVMNDQFFIDFFHAFELAIRASIALAQLSHYRSDDESYNRSYLYDPYLQNYINILLDDQNIATPSAFYQNVLGFSQESINHIHGQLQLIVSMQEEMVGVLKKQGGYDSIAQGNLTVFKQFLNFIDQR